MKNKLQEILSGNYAILTAENPGNVKLPASTNKILNDHLECYLSRCGIKRYPVQGNYGGVAENAFLLINISPYDASEIGARYYQESVITSDGLVYSNGTLHAATDEIIIDENLQENFSIITIDGIDIKFQIILK